MGDRMTIGQRLKLVRNEAKLSLEKTGALFDITAQTLSRYENCERRPDNDFLREFGKHFNLSGDWLLYDEPPMRKATDMDKSIKGSFFELTNLINAKKAPDVPISNALGDFLGKITEDNPDNFILMFEYMLKYAPVRKNMFQFFFLFQKPMIDEGLKLLQQGQD
jgi:transcriptional regulator with XRE-family HTH domain